jgi:hypothetical protein
VDLHRAETEPKSSDRTFGFVMAVAFAVICFIPWVRRGTEPRWYLLPLALVFLGFALFSPKKLRKLHLAWLNLGLFLQKFTSPVFLGVIYLLFFTPMGLLLRLFRADPLRRKLDPEAKTYWITRPTEMDPGKGMKHQF